MSIEAMRLALEALEGWANHGNWVWPESALEQAKRNTVEAITALRTAIEQAEQEPVAWVCYGVGEKHDLDYQQEDVDALPIGTMLYAAAPRQWVKLTDEEIKEIIGPWGETPIRGYTRRLFDEIEAKLKEKNR